MSKNYLQRFNELCRYNRTTGIVTETINQLNLVKDIIVFLNNNYKPGNITTVGVDGRIETKKVIGVKSTDDKGQCLIATQISPLDVFYRVEDQFKNDIEKSENRTTFLKQCIIDWFNEYDGLKNGNLSKNLSY